MEIRAPKGTRDITPQESYKWHFIEHKMRKAALRNGYEEVRTPVFEHTELFLRGVGNTTDIVQKEMYTFLDKGARSVTLKPEGTAGVVRQFIENKQFADSQPTKMFYLYCPVFRYEKPDAGRLREHHQFGIELFGAKDASADAEIICVALSLLESIGIGSLKLKLNSIGCDQCRPLYNQTLKDYFSKNLDDMCDDCKGRFDKNPLRMLDCKNEGCKPLTMNAPIITDHLCDACDSHFKKLQSYLNVIGVPFEFDPYIVRGLDYYTKTVFEIVSENRGASGTICGGGRYDKLIGEIGGVDLPGVGFGMGMERLLMVIDELGIEIPMQAPNDLYICNYGEEAKLIAFSLAYQLRRQGIKVEIDNCSRSMKAQFKYADKLGVPFTLVIGDDEIANGEGKIKIMSQSREENVRLDALCIEEFIRNFKK